VAAAHAAALEWAETAGSVDGELEHGMVVEIQVGLRRSWQAALSAWGSLRVPHLMFACVGEVHG